MRFPSLYDDSGIAQPGDPYSILPAGVRDLCADADGFHIGGGGSTQKTTQHDQTQYDAQTQARMGSIWNAGEAAGNAGASPLANQAGNTFSDYQSGGNLGFAALMGDPNASKAFMNPYQQQVIDANNANLARVNEQTSNQVNDEATRAGAFGGSRHGVAEGVALSNNDMANQRQNAQLLDQGYGAAMNQAATTANLGFGAAQQGAQLGLAGVGSPDLYRLNMLKQGYVGPTGQQSNGAQTTSQGSVGIGFGF